jgi:hypothetical protein
VYSDWVMVLKTRFQYLTGEWGFLFVTMSRLAIGPTHPPIQRVIGILTLTVKLSERERNLLLILVVPSLMCADTRHISICLLDVVFKLYAVSPVHTLIVYYQGVVNIVKSLQLC